jgi:hypothetical protein
VPFVDFAVFGPYGARTQRANAFSGMALGPNGLVQQIDFKGPPTIEDWEAHFKVFATGLIMLNAVDPYTVLGDGSYSAFIIKMAHQFGTQCYPLIYQTECRFRREALQHIRRRESNKLNALLKAHGAVIGAQLAQFNPDRPWNSIFYNAENESKYWKDNLELPCLRIIAGQVKVHQLIDGDAEVHPIGPVDTRTRARPRAKVVKTIQKTPKNPQPAPAADVSKQFCRNWNADKCTDGACPNGRKHACEICGGPHKTKNHGGKTKKVNGKGGKGKKGKGGKGGKKNDTEA